MGVHKTLRNRDWIWTEPRLLGRVSHPLSLGSKGALLHPAEFSQ